MLNVVAHKVTTMLEFSRKC